MVPHPLFGCDTNDRFEAGRQPQHITIRVAAGRKVQPLNRYLMALRAKHPQQLLL
jgi:hypothetical protein